MSKHDDAPEKGSDRDAPTDDEPTPTLVGNLDGRPDLYVPVDLVEAAGLEIGDTAEVERQGDEIVVRAEREDRDDADRWEYETGRALASVRSGLFNAEIDADLDEPIATVSILPVDGSMIPFAVDVADGGDTIAALAYLPPDDAEALAADLREQARIARGDDE